MPNHKCLMCNKKLRSLMIQMYTCRCKDVFCSEHLHSHSCPHVAEKVKLETIKGVKVEKI